MKSLYCFVYILMAKQKKVIFRHPADTQQYFNCPLGENKIGEEYPSAGRKIAQLSVCRLQYGVYWMPIFL